MNTFDKLCAVAAFPIGLLLLIVGIIGLFAGCSANFSLPPVFGVIPAFVGWGIVRAIYLGWNRPVAEDDVKLKPEKWDGNLSSNKHAWEDSTE